MHWPELMPQDVLPDMSAQLAARLEIEAVMDSAKDPRVGDIVGNIGECAVIQNDPQDSGRAHADVMPPFAENILEYGKRSPCRAAVIRRITGIRRSGDEGQPGWIGRGLRIAVEVGGADRRHRA